MLTPDQLLQVLSWPAILRTFVYNHKGYPTPCAQAPTVSSFRAALQPFWRTLTTLTFTISGSCFISVKAINDDLQTTAQDNHDPYLDMSSFHILKDLQLPSHFLVGLPGKDYTRDHLLTLLPSSLQSLEIDFGPRDVFLSRDLHHRHWSLEMYYWASDRVDKHGWLYALQGQCHKNGQFPCLKKVVVSNYGRTEAWCQAYGLRQDFAKKGVQLHVALSNASVYGRNNDDDGYERDYDYGDNWYNDAPMFGQEPTEHSSSPRGTELLYHSDLDKHEEELLRMESWDGFDARMASERKRVEESWVRGQWPDYEESREERNETFRYTVRDGVYES
ncbi:hypothetical protein MMC18_008806 [Xylographa bjoerkii]|nr:hypothetical protein [Xylographa bjoerkii]